MSIRLKLFLSFLLAVLIPFVLISHVSTRAFKKNLKETIGRDLGYLAREKAGRISYAIKARVAEAERLALLPPVRDAVRQSNLGYDNRDEREFQRAIALIDSAWTASKGQTAAAREILSNDLSGFLTIYKERNPEEYGEIFVTDIKGATVAMTGVLSDYNQADEGWWERSFNGGKGGVFIDDRGFDESAGAVVLGVAVPVYEKDKVIGILKLNTKVDEILDIVSDVRLGKDDFAFLMRSQGDILVHSGATRDVSPTHLERERIKGLGHGWGEDVHEGQGMIEAYAQVDSEIFKRIPAPGSKEGISGEAWEPTQWFLFIERDQNQALAPVRKLEGVLFRAQVGLLFLMLVMVGLTAKSFSDPICALSEGARTVGEGNLYTKVGTNRKDELGDLSREFDKMTDHLKETMASRDELNQVITERKKVEHDLERMFGLSGALVCIATMDGYFKKVSPAFERTLGYPLQEFLEHPFYHFMHPDDREKTDNVIKEKLGKGVEVFGFENRYRCKDGSYKWFDWSARPVVDEGLMFAIAYDITGRKRTEMECREKMADLEKFHKVAVGRELKMIELKARIARLEAEKDKG